ncbi:Wadjet anti-phage system protein JetD domain-containing protein [Sinomonas terrae]|uniref:DUF2220 domain-containing protein n=1 Tax=Sinomonas terrae TaxID=2908838 RepID=A0ABS9U0N2_9MICC|nr:Wadjet anti-phage system protein JetD domain-containing protein [Sinomonas terrae]MCH6470241.1 DUF2220 domain-containing protein [Sinomonas terrae]
MQALTGLDDLGLLPGHAPRIHFTYLDPDHRAAGKRVNDSATVGDSFTAAYLPDIVVISENKDTAIHFPPLTRGVSVEGVGKGGKTPAAFVWIREAPVVIYWGDIARDGFEILNGYRIDFDRDIDSILMGPETCETYEEFGTDYDQHCRLLEPGDPKPVDRLHDDERSVYLCILNDGHAGHRRVEQERLPLSVHLKPTVVVREGWLVDPSDFVGDVVLDEVGPPGVDVARYLNYHEDPGGLSQALGRNAIESVQQVAIPLPEASDGHWVKMAAPVLEGASDAPVPAAGRLARFMPPSSPRQ